MTDFVPLRAPSRRRIRLRCTCWHGHPPRRGDYLRNESPRARTAYRVLRSDMTWCVLETRAGGIWKGPIWCLRLAIRELPVDAVVHLWRWNRPKKRSRK